MVIWRNAVLAKVRAPAIFFWKTLAMIEYELEYQIVTVSQLFSSNIFKAIDNLEEIFDREHRHHGKAKYNWPPCTDCQ